LDSVLERHRFGYRQPIAGSPILPDARISAVLVPALAFDQSGNRLGFGAGYYDRLLARLPHALKIGIADFVVDAELPTESFDVAMTHLATTAGTIVVG
jgi:5-formyltetrahydrofolate cyclo-ligase